MTSAKLTLAISVLLLMNCQNKFQKENSNQVPNTDTISLGENDFVYFVNSYNVHCTGVGLQMCLQIQKGRKIKPGAWKLFYDHIQGFEWEPGFMYQLIVREDQLHKDKIPADASYIKYTLVKELSKETDPVGRLHDIWTLESIQGKNVSEYDAEERPTMEINLTMKQVMGTDGCNNYTGKIEQVDGKTVHFSPLVATRKACPQMNLPDLFQNQMEKVRAWSLDHLILNLLDAKGHELMTFRKVD